MTIIDLRPADTPEYMTGAWVGCLHWAISEPGILAAFRADTGNHWMPARTAFEQMIDTATGADFEFVKAFVLWANVNVWGPIDADGNQPSTQSSGLHRGSAAKE